MNPNFLVTIKSKDKSFSRSFPVRVKDEKEAEEWGKRCLEVNNRRPENYKVSATPFLVPIKTEEEIRAEDAAKKPKKNKKALAKNV